MSTVSSDRQQPAAKLLVVEDELLRQQMQHLAIRRQRHRPRPVHRRPHLLARNLPHPAAHADAAPRVHPAHMRPANPHHRRLNPRLRHAFRRQRRAIDHLGRRPQLCDQTLAHPPRRFNAMPAIPQHAILQLRYQHTALGTSRVKHGDQIVLLLIHGWATWVG